MDEAVRTTASPAAIWVIVIVMSIMTAILVSAAAVADSWVARADRRARRFGALGLASVGTTALDADTTGPSSQESTATAERTATGESTVPAESTATGESTVPAESTATAETTAPAEGTTTGQGTTTGESTAPAAAVARETVPAPRAGAAGPSAPGGTAPATPPAADVQAGTEQAGAESSAGRHRRADPETVAAEAPTLPDLPAVPGKHAMPGQRSGDADRAERSRAGTAAPEDEDPGDR